MDSPIVCKRARLVQERCGFPHKSAVTYSLPLGLFLVHSFSLSMFPTPYAFHFRSLFYIYRDLSLATLSILSLLLGGGLYLSLSQSPLPTPTPLCSTSHSSPFHTVPFPDNLLVLRHHALSAYFPWTIIRSCSLL